MDPLQESKKLYRQLIDGMCAIAGIQDPAALYANCGMTVDDVTFTLAHAHFVHPDLVVAFIDFGKPLAEKRELVLQRLLETNIYMFYDGDSPSFSLNPESGHVLLMTRICLPLVTPASVLAQMRFLAVQAKAWREHFFLGEESQSQGAGMAETKYCAIQHKLTEAVANLPKKG